ncbi:gamma-glutamyltranspeptidase/glutathione hydrolase [Rhodobium orientis]|uniref:Glutathione hydrolase proenzyme n=1 Tax=Rhodobium orientis TaxID=34017 RepID=A0A327JTQ7_9HYPH|nr:gamma-glutamyltransferase [Rhodobium orientis]MBB4304339.1 gamma-glutamyltranspeptidase/glutathione hydrolase [Rhodobium orientis]MBK5948167.1 gamma-glutamyltransferase [Rhodobium orientis]RAI28833.1 gamma-glutamyltransferase [Rhodobium orientis]
MTLCKFRAHPTGERRKAGRTLLNAAVAASLALVPATLGFRPVAAQPAILSGNDRVHPVAANHGMVASQEERASRIGLEILQKGGNAVDAAVAVGFALAVTLPRAGNLGGGGFMIVHLAPKDGQGTGKTVAIDYREMAPEAAFRDMFLDKDGNADSDKSRYSGLAVGVPGTVAGLAHAQKTYGSGKFTLAELIAPAEALARDGMAVSDDLAWSLGLAMLRLKKDPDAARIFYKPSGAPYGVGDTLVQKDLADSLALIADKGPDGFYKGPVAAAIARAVSEAGGAMTEDDLAAYEVKEREPVRGTYRGFDVVSMPPPSSGGVHIVQILNILEGFPLAASGFGSAETMHEMAEAMKLAYADRSEFLGDPDHVAVPVKALTATAYADALRKTIDKDRARPAVEIKPGDPAPYESAETTHFSVVDADGNAVANTYTLNFSYGVGIVAPGTGILLNNELDDFSAKPGIANAYGLIGGEANAVAPRKRPLSSMSPTMVFRDGTLVLVTGSPGGSRIITTVLQIVLNVVDHGMNIAEATLAPRMHHQWLPDELRVEEGFSPDTLRLLAERGHDVVTKTTMGSTQSIRVRPGMLTGASDPRRRGAATVGY